VERIPSAVLVGTFALLANECGVNFPRITPIPTNIGQMIAASGLETDGAILALGKTALPNAPLE
jgi:hypothetical protein